MSKLDDIAREYSDRNANEAEECRRIKDLFLELITGSWDDTVFVNTKHLSDWKNGYDTAKREMRQKVNEQ